MKIPRALLAGLICTLGTHVGAQFVAFNDHDGGEGSAHPFVTRYSLSYASQSNVVQGPLRDIADGSFLPVELRIEGGVIFPVPTTNFVSGTPAAMIFGCSDFAPCIVDFRGSSPRLAGTVTYTFSGLNPARKYQFIGTANFSGFPAIESTRTLYGIYGVDSYRSAHTTNCLTNYSSFIASNQVAVPTGRNAQPGFGDMAVWNEIRVGNDGSFSVTASNFFNETGAPFGGLRLVEDFVDPTGPFIFKQPAGMSASRGSSQTLAPQISGSLPLSFQWFKDGSALSAGTNRILTFSSLQPQDGGVYWLVVTNPYGTVTTSNVTVAVLNDAIGIVAQPLPRTLRYGEVLSLSITVTGTPPRFFQWYQSGSAIRDATNSTFIVGAADLNDAGTYLVRASNLFSSTVSSMTSVTVAQTPLRITDDPLSLTVTQGTTLRLQVAVAGSAPRFQWFRNGAMVAGAVNSVYRVASTTTNNAGSYFVVVSGPMNMVTSAVANVKVVPPAPRPQIPGSFPLLALTNVWAYDQSGLELGTAWREAGYDDSTWSRGRSVLGIETSLPTAALTNTVLRLTNDSGQPIITSYFRTHFFWPTSSIGAVLVFSNLIDDGAIFYLNGIPLLRQNMPAGAVSGSTLAPAASLEGLFVVTNLAAPAIMEGDNVLAVEVHQNSPTSSDIVFGTSVLGYNLPESPLTILSSPAGQTVIERQPLQLDFLLNAPARIHWYRDGLPVAGAFGPTLLINAIAPSDSGGYFAVATNSLGAVTSAVAIVQVVADTRPPRIVTAFLQTNRTEAIVRFDEPLLFSTASNTSNYQVQTSDSSEAATVISASYSNGQVALQFSVSLPEGTNFILRLNGVADVSAAANQLTDFLVPLSQLVLLVPLEGIWKYNDTGADLGTGWKEPSYDDSSWFEGPALLYNDTAYGGGDVPPPVPPPLLVTNTWIQLTNDGVPIVTHYLRRGLGVNAVSPLGAQLSLQTMIDDGAVMYLNGSEFFRLGITNHPVYATTLASRSRGITTEGTIEGPFVTSPTNFVLGSNTLAVEVHQLSLVDMSFGAEVSLLAKSFPNEPVRILRQPNDAFVREGDPFSFEVDSIAAITAQWLKDGTPLAGANRESVSVGRAALSDNGTRFSIVLSNEFSFASSSNAILHVMADTNPPSLLSAQAGQSLTEIRLPFSEPIDPASALNSARYTVRDGAGHSIAVAGVTIADETNVVLTTVPRIAGRNYEVRVEGIRDIAAALNEIEPGSGATLGYEHVLVPLTALWRYDQSGNGQVEAWKHVGFDDSEWPAGEALLYNDTFTTAFPAVPLRTLLSQTNAVGVPIITHYFRHAFTLPLLDEGTRLSVRHAVDDGVAIYLNGTPILNEGVPVGPIDATTLASVLVGDAILTAPIAIEFAGPPGISVLAAETHQISTTAPSDVSFAAELSVIHSSTVLPAPGPTLRITRVGAQLQLLWSGGYLLESAASLDESWSTVDGAASPLTIQVGEAARFYRLRKP